jgi:hypothetical protein
MAVPKLSGKEASFPSTEELTRPSRRRNIDSSTLMELLSKRTTLLIKILNVIVESQNRNLALKKQKTLVTSFALRCFPRIGLLSRDKRPTVLPISL